MAYDLFAYQYDRLMEDMPYAEWLRFLQECWDKYGRPQTIVDLGCGTGSIAIPLAREGHEVFGIDLSEDMLAVAQHKANEAEDKHRHTGKGRSSITWLQQDMRDWSLLRPVDAVISLCDCINYLLEEEEVRQTFSRTYAGLKAGGLFVFDVHTAYQFETYAEEQPFFLNDDDVAYIWTSELDMERCQIEHALTIFAKRFTANGAYGDQTEELFQRIEEYHIQRAYSLEWLESELLAAGFAQVESCTDFTWQPLTEHTQRAFFIARK
jgi:SAM-dependent methyltransferase